MISDESSKCELMVEAWMGWRRAAVFARAEGGPVLEMVSNQAWSMEVVAADARARGAGSTFWEVNGVMNHMEASWAWLGCVFGVMGGPVENILQVIKAPAIEAASGVSFRIGGRAGWGAIGTEVQFSIAPPMVAADASTRAGEVRLASSSWVVCRGRKVDGIQIVIRIRRKE